MTSFAQEFAASRRLFILRLLVERDGEMIESVVYKVLCKGFHSQTTREDVRRDLDHLREARCLTEEWGHPSVCLVRITARGEDAAYGKIDVAGVERSRWDR